MTTMLVWYTHRGFLRHSRTRWPVAMYALIRSMGGIVVNITEEVKQP